MKKLSKTIGDEVWIRPRYAIVRFMKSKTAFKIKDNQPMICTIKPINESGMDQIQLHIRVNGRDYWNKLDDQIDIDVYIPKATWEEKLCG